MKISPSLVKEFILEELYEAYLSVRMLAYAPVHNEHPGCPSILNCCNVHLLKQANSV